jgi:hypothetical protein
MDSEDKTRGRNILWKIGCKKRSKGINLNERERVFQMNNKGQIFFYTFMLGIVVIILALSLAYPVYQVVDTARGNSTEDFIGMNCTSPPDNYYRGACLITDVSLPYFIIGLLAIGGAVIGAKLLFE